jgi:hypothetical protein
MLHSNIFLCCLARGRWTVRRAHGAPGSSPQADAHRLVCGMFFDDPSIAPADSLCIRCLPGPMQTQSNSSPVHRPVKAQSNSSPFCCPARSKPYWEFLTNPNPCGISSTQVMISRESNPEWANRMRVSSQAGVKTHEGLASSRRQAGSVRNTHPVLTSHGPGPIHSPPPQSILFPPENCSSTIATPFSALRHHHMLIFPRDTAVVCSVAGRMEF